MGGRVILSRTLARVYSGGLNSTCPSRGPNDRSLLNDNEFWGAIKYRNFFIHFT
jgi:hypothetical protein